ncbi:hypothetical protein P691DRAFT_782332 [Macrolepiota fuliginosa MF-IS2]|uniref:Uncharacterized protein n=1 Tax=Macrolepiota fuliginosa MF-IS2 TaxID=1400762 RepID=A0A9P5WXS8_9AGAR|nr:hypothetical protein P691DRAFT_782332 [Macrolepiota fuliginosa MF-IS2]
MEISTAKPGPLKVLDTSGKWRLPTPDSSLKHSLDKLSLSNLLSMPTGSFHLAILATAGPSSVTPVEGPHLDSSIQADINTKMLPVTTDNHTVLAVDHMTFRDSQEEDISNRDAERGLDNSQAP